MNYELGGNNHGMIMDKEASKMTEHYKYETSWQSSRKGTCKPDFLGNVEPQ